MPLACLPVPIAGRNRVWRDLLITAITSDPDWRQGEYTSPPAQGLKAAVNILLMMTSSPLQWHKQGPTRSAADAFLEDQWKRRISSTDAMDLLAVEVVHPSGAPSCALRLEWQQRVFAYSGDTAWTEALITVANGADLFVCECYAYDKAVPFHLNYCTMVERLADLAPRRIILTHLGTDMLAHRSRVSLECAEDGQLVTF